MDASDDEDALAAMRECADERRATGQLFRRPPSPKRFSSSQPIGSSPAPMNYPSPKAMGNPFLLDDDDEITTSETFAQYESFRSDRQFLPTAVRKDEQSTSLPYSLRKKSMADASVEARNSDGTVVRVRRRKRLTRNTCIEAEIDEEHASKSKHYGMSIHTLISQVERTAAKRLTERSEQADEECIADVRLPHRDLWVDRYRPSKFTDLLGDERVNRDVMKWIRHWDYCVFGRKVQVQGDRGSQAMKVEADTASEYNDPYQRPQRKILMMTGPPGFGKTTLAHIAAKQAGYNVIEVNASDDRTGSIVQNKIGDALKSQAVFNPRPSLVIIDEIDGVSSAGGEAGFIKSLLQFVVDDERTTNQLSNPSTGNTNHKRKSKRRDAKALLRPIICICNDQYVAALRPLRQYCQIINFKPLAPATMVARLVKICRKEGLQADARALNTLCEVTENDLRACVTSLQYVRMKSTNFTLESVSTTLAQKDMSRSSHSVVETVFKLPDAKKERKKGATATLRANNQVGRIADLAMTNNEYSKILGGCFAHYPSAAYHDHMFSKPAAASDWLFLYDRCERGVYEQQHGELMMYMPYTVAAFHHLFATHDTGTTITRSKADWETREKLRVNSELLAGWIAGVKSSLRQTFTPLTFASELMSYGLRIIGPNLNPANAHLVKAGDRLALSKVIDGMLSLGLQYVQYRVDDGSYVFRLEPPVTQLLNFTGVLEQKGESLLPSRYAARQIISAELAAEKIRRSLENGGPVTNKGNLVGKADKNTKKRKASADLSTLPAVKKDFFGRAIPVFVQDSGTTKSTAGISDKRKATVHIKFSDGFSDAVRNNISIRELLRC